MRAASESDGSGPIDVFAFPKQNSARERWLLVTLRTPSLGAWTFDLVLVERDGRWLVDYWMPAGGAPMVPAA